MTKAKGFLNYFLNPIVPVILALLGAFIFIDAYGPADALNYHFAFSIRFTGLKGFPDFSGYFEDIYKGFPILWRLVLAPGLALDQPRLFLLPNIAALGLFSFLCHRFLRLPLAIAAGSCLVFPVALFGFRTPLQDFFVNCMVGSAMLLLLYPRRAERPSPKRSLLLPRELFGFVLLAIAANVKFQGFFMAFILLPCWAFLRWREHKQLFPDSPSIGDRRKSLWQGVLAVLLCLAIAFQPIHNSLKFGNPFFPIQFAGLKGSSAKTYSPIQYLPKIPFVFNFTSFLVSSTEIDPIIRAEAGWNFQRSWHNFNLPNSTYMDKKANHPWVMTGGSNGIVFILLTFGAFLTLFRGRQALHSMADLAIYSLQRRLMAVAFLFTFLPQAMELRYYMVILFMVAVVATSSMLLTVQTYMRWLVAAGLWFIIASAFLYPTYFWARTGQWSTNQVLLTPNPLDTLKPSIDCAAVIQNTQSGKRAIAMGPKSIQEQLKCYILERSSR
jgi:hypothetical protein